VGSGVAERGGFAIGMSNLIIIDRKKRRRYLMMDEQVNDPLGVDQAKHEKARTIEVPSDSDNPVHKFLREWKDHTFLLGHKAFCLNDKKDIMTGHIVKVIAPNWLVLKKKDACVRFEDVISIGD